MLGAAEGADPGRPVAARDQPAVGRPARDRRGGVVAASCSATRRRPSSRRVGQLVMLTQRIGKSANEFLTTEGVSPEAAFLLGKDLNSFREISEGLLDGSPQMRLPGTRDPQVRERLAALMKQYEETRTRGSVILEQPAGPERGARGAEQRSSPTASRCAKASRRCRSKLGSETGLERPDAAAPAALRRCSSSLGGAGFLRLYVAEQGQRASLAQNRRLEAEGQEKEAKRVNDANQAAILRLMNELQGVAEGDLTQQATVTEDITGAIADSVNYTVEELRTLVSQVQGTVGRVTGDDRAGRGQLDRAAGDLVRAAARDPRHRRVGAADGRPHQRRVGAGAGNGAGRAPVAAGGRVGPAGGAEHDRRHELDPRPDPGNVEADQAARRVVAGDRRDHRADLGHHRADQRAGAERRDPGGLGRRRRPRLLGRCRGSAAAGRALGRRDAADRGARQDDPDRHPGRGRRHGAIDAGRGRGNAAVRRGRHGARRDRPRHAPADRPGRRDLAAGALAKRSRRTSSPPTSSTSSR